MVHLKKFSSMAHLELHKYLLASISIVFTRLNNLRHLTLSSQDIGSGPFILFPTD